LTVVTTAQQKACHWISSCKWTIYCRNYTELPADALLSMTTGKLVTNCWISLSTHSQM